jgi:hypothetical protein
MIIYLASPYTHPDPKVEERRFRQICFIAGDLILRGYHIFCPIAMAHPIRIAVGLESKFDFWEEFDKKMLEACSELWVATLPGWDKSVGVRAEMEYMKKLDKQVCLIEPDTLEKTKYTG